LAPHTTIAPCPLKWLCRELLPSDGLPRCDGEPSRKGPIGVTALFAGRHRKEL